MSNADDEVLIGTYTTSPINTHTFNVAGGPESYYLGIVEDSKRVYSKSMGDVIAVPTVVPNYKITKTIKMSEDEFQFFKNEVLNKKVKWKFRGVEIPGTWSTSGVSVGGKRSSYRRRSCRRRCEARCSTSGARRRVQHDGAGTRRDDAREGAYVCFAAICVATLGAGCVPCFAVAVAVPIVEAKLIQDLNVKL